MAGGLSSARGRREGRKEREGEKKKKRKIGKRKGEGKKRERERERDRACASEIHGVDRGWSATHALLGDTQRVARSGKKKMGRQPNSGVGTAKIAGKGFEKN